MNDYDNDVYAWSQRQGALLRRLAAGERINDADLDWPNIAEEIETVGRSERGALRSHIQTIIEHLIKLQVSPATEPRAGWQETIDRSRSQIADLLDDSPSLRPAVAGLVAGALPKAIRLAVMALARHGEVAPTDLHALTFSADHILDDWFPDNDAPKDASRG